MLAEFVCLLCVKKVTYERDGRGHHPRFCVECRAERKRATNRSYIPKRNEARKQKRAEAAKAAKVVRKCRRCGKVFEQDARPSLYAISAASDGYVLRSYCKSCAWVMKRAARACDPRYAEVGGHCDILAEGPIAR